MNLYGGLWRTLLAAGNSRNGSLGEPRQRGRAIGWEVRVRAFLVLDRSGECGQGGAGFAVSMMFLAAAATYALYLSGAANAIFGEIAAVADRAAYDAGFRLEDLAVSGSKNTPQATLLKALDLPYAKSSLSYDAAEAQDRLLKLGWIVSAGVRRILPSRLEVVLTEREPFAQMGRR